MTNQTKTERKILTEARECLTSLKWAREVEVEEILTTIEKNRESQRKIFRERGSQIQEEAEEMQKKCLRESKENLKDIEIEGQKLYKRLMSDIK